MRAHEHAQQVATWLSTVVAWQVREDASAFALVQALAERVERCEHLPVQARSQDDGVPMERAQLAVLGGTPARAQATRVGGA
jgi:hypothetical protein